MIIISLAWSIGQLVMIMVLVILLFDKLLFTCLNSLSTGRLRQGLLLMRRRGTVMVTARPPILPFTSLFPTTRFELKKSQLLILCSGWCLAAQGREASGGGEPRLESLHWSPESARNWLEMIPHCVPLHGLHCDRAFFKHKE